ncbi:MAG: tetratricopeptide repeat protein [Planctomycetota bacterium]|nr:tetratricopeptide repeat protein [Planctomycetota bacterium]
MKPHLTIVLLLLVACAATPEPPSEAEGPYWEVEDPLGKADTIQPRPGDLEALDEAAHLYRVSIQRDGETFAALWKGARSLCRIAQATTSEEIQATTSAEALQNCKRAKVLQPRRVEARYFLALAAGLLAETRSVGGRQLVSTIETEATEAVRLDRTFENAAPLLLLGQLYHQAPGFPISVGDTELALEKLEEAFEIAPDHPPNRIALAEVYLDEGRGADARKVIETLIAENPDLPPRWPERWKTLRARLGSP